jgi:hypothetical protein
MQQLLFATKSKAQPSRNQGNGPRISRISRIKKSAFPYLKSVVKILVNALGLTGVAEASVIAWFSRITGARNPVSQSKSNQIKPWVKFKVQSSKFTAWSNPVKPGHTGVGGGM